ncbi:hypothetical protein [Bradyrhizobium ivorense]|nr:hypothetical protein [Bradyrhizobium ivorense]
MVTIMPAAEVPDDLEFDAFVASADIIGLVGRAMLGNGVRRAHVPRH